MAIGTCSCPEVGFYEKIEFIHDDFDISGYRTEYTCESCNETCSTCNGPNKENCLSCQQTAYQLENSTNGTTENVTCLVFKESCKDYGMYYTKIEDQNMCKKCHTSCLECSGPTDKDCTKCILDNENPLNSLYLDPTINKCLSICPEGTTYLFGKNECVPCDKGVKVCKTSYPKIAIKCEDKYFKLPDVTGQS